jgi:anaphase-promoting complex subunit 8
MDIRNKDPYRFESMDIFSNILYVQERTNELGKLALSCFDIDKHIPETLCILGNYYSLIGEHSKAV